MSNEPTRPIFSGKSDEQVAPFIRRIQEISFAQGRQRDNDWQADYAATCLDGDALRWYSELNDETRNSWNELRRALLQRFPPPAANQPPEAVATSPPPPLPPPPPPPEPSATATATIPPQARRLPVEDEEEPPSYSSATSGSAPSTVTTVTIDAEDISSRSGIIAVVNKYSYEMIGYLPRFITGQVEGHPFVNTQRDALVVDLPPSVGESSHGRLKIHTVGTFDREYLVLTRPLSPPDAFCLQVSALAGGDQMAVNPKIWSRTFWNGEIQLIVTSTGDESTTLYPMCKADPPQLWMLPNDPRDSDEVVSLSLV
ncbi:hypothetical protein FRB95_005203 [Tulasnella sp. JGI-2019a]|nr:hypothetical protein FRB95_005203 [Tulasnella sp. JGI-2019a]